MTVDERIRKLSPADAAATFPSYFRAHASSSDLRVMLERVGAQRHWNGRPQSQWGAVFQRLVSHSQDGGASLITLPEIRGSSSWLRIRSRLDAYCRVRGWRLHTNRLGADLPPHSFYAWVEPL